MRTPAAIPTAIPTGMPIHGVTPKWTSSSTTV